MKILYIFPFLEKFPWYLVLTISKYGLESSGVHRSDLVRFCLDGIWSDLDSVDLIWSGCPIRIWLENLAVSQPFEVMKFWVDSKQIHSDPVGYGKDLPLGLWPSNRNPSRLNHSHPISNTVPFRHHNFWRWALLLIYSIHSKRAVSLGGKWVLEIRRFLLLVTGWVIEAEWKGFKKMGLETIPYSMYQVIGCCCIEMMTTNYLIKRFTGT